MVGALAGGYVLRIGLLIFALIGLTSVPTSVGAPEAIEKPLVLMIYMDEGENLVAWSATPGAIAYFVYRGTSLETLELIYYGELPWLEDEVDVDAAYVYGVTAWNGHVESDMHWTSVDTTENKCVTWNTRLKVSVSASGCLS